jgi:hypothetical protein
MGIFGKNKSKLGEEEIKEIDRELEEIRKKYEQEILETISFFDINSLKNTYNSWGLIIEKGLYYEDNDLKIAESLFREAKLFARNSYRPLLKNFPELVCVLESNLLSLWDFLFHVCCIGTAFMMIADTVPNKNQYGIADAVMTVMDNWQSDSHLIMLFFTDYTTTLSRKEVPVDEAIGSWFWLNFEMHPKSNKDLIALAKSLKFEKIIGRPILVYFHNWWD